MRFLILLLSLIIISETASSQEVYFPNHGDGTKDIIATFGYKSTGSKLYVNVGEVDSIKSDNGIIKPIKNDKYRYICKPDSIGKLSVIVFFRTKNGKHDSIKKSITIIEKPILKFVVHREKNILTFNLIDQENKVVSGDYYSALEIKFDGGDQNRNGIMSNWKNKINLDDILPKDEFEKKEISRITFSTTALYNRKLDLFTGYYSCSIKL